jgi:hypothetical protein
MEYTGKLYGKIGNKYFNTGRTSEEFDKYEKMAIELQLLKDEKKQVNDIDTSQDKALHLADVSGSLCGKCGNETKTMVTFEGGRMCFNCYNKIKHNYR